MNLQKLQNMGNPYSGYMFSVGDSDGSSSGTSDINKTYTDSKFQQDYFKKLLGEAGTWLERGGMGEQDTAQADQMKGALQDMQSYYTDMMQTAPQDDALLQRQLNTMSEQSARNLGRQTAAIGQQANLAGGAGGSRQGIAEGIAAGDAASSLQAQQAGVASDFYQRGADRELQQKNAALSGLGNVAQGYGALQNFYKTPQERMAESLGMYGQMIGGDMGGIRTEIGTESSDQKSSGSNWGFQLSDKNAKKNIKKVGETEVGDGKVGVYEFEYKEGEGETKGKKFGVMAQEVEKVKPEAVKEEVVNTGKKKKKRKKVNYGALSDE